MVIISESRVRIFPSIATKVANILLAHSVRVYPWRIRLRLDPLHG